MLPFLSGILHKYESFAFRQITRAQNTIYPSSIYTRFNTRFVTHLFSYTDTLFYLTEN